jgi:hypothetical protein
MGCGGLLNSAIALGVIGVAACSSPAHAASDKADLTALVDLPFGLIGSFTDQSLSESVCAFASSSIDLYSVYAAGDGSGGAFTLTNGSAQLPYEVLWADAPSQTGGTALGAGSTVGNFASTTQQHTCNSGPRTTASLTVVIRSAALNAAMAGDYSGTLTVIIQPQ